ncbi:helix-turn-helix transcriptional regulator [Staphylococcus succinus]|uniref:helix-turn-helix transcriptional regulator n=1 Tax=Staphylococcus succinus TaxID=61015 RepID=UPI001304C95A|nr:helix-turn-helix transcriptional regulator [Staphylococcus succinus]
MGNTIGNYISELRSKVNITNKQLTDSSNVSYSYLSNLEKGRKDNPTISTLNKIAIGFSEYGLDKDTILFELLKRTPGYDDENTIKSIVKKESNKNNFKNIGGYYFNAKGELQEPKPVPQKNLIDLRDVLNVKNKIGTKYTFKELDHEHTITLGKNIKQQILNVVDELVKLHVYNNPELLNNDEADNEAVDWKLSTNKLRIIEQQDVSNEESDN